MLLVALGLEPRHFADNYFILAKKSFWDPHLYTAPRPFGLYWFYKVAQYDPDWVVVLQCAISSMAWSFLGYVLAGPIKNLIPACLLIVATSFASLSWILGGWNFVMLTESLSASSLALFLGSFLLLWQKPNPSRLVALLAISFYLAFLRDTLPFFIATFAGLCWGLLFLQRKTQPNLFRYLTRFLVYSVILLCSSSWSAMLGSRHTFSLYNVLFKRILPNPEYSAWFETHGMPLYLLVDGPHEWEGQWASSHDRALYIKLDYMPLHQWSIFEGKGDLVHFLLTHPAYVWNHAWRDRAEIFKGSLTDYIGDPPAQPMFHLANWLWSSWSPWVWLPLFLIYAFLLMRGKVSPIPLLIAIAAFINAVLAYHADAMEVTRHCLFTRWVFLVATWHALLLVLNFAIGQWKQGVKVNDSSATA